MTFDQEGGVALRDGMLEIRISLRQTSTNSGRGRDGTTRVGLLCGASLLDDFGFTNFDITTCPALY